MCVQRDRGSERPPLPTRQQGAGGSQPWTGVHRRDRGGKCPAGSAESWADGCAVKSSVGGAVGGGRNGETARAHGRLAGAAIRLMALPGYAAEAFLGSGSRRRNGSE